MTTAIFQQKLEEALISAFQHLASDPANAVSYAKDYNLEAFIIEQKTLVAGSGAAANLIPGAHLAAMVADLVFLLNRMSFCAWGIGAINDCKVFGITDFEQILYLWCGEHADWDNFSAISLNLASTIENVAAFDPKEMDAHAYYNQVANLYSTGESLSSAIKNINQYQGSKGLKKKLARKKVVKFSSKLATKLSVKLTNKLGAKAISGVVPIIGSLVGGGVNVWIMNGLAEASISYYHQAK